MTQLVYSSTVAPNIGVPPMPQLTLSFCPRLPLPLHRHALSLPLRRHSLCLSRNPFRATPSLHVSRRRSPCHKRITTRSLVRCFRRRWMTTPMTRRRAAVIPAKTTMPPPFVHRRRRRQRRRRLCTARGRPEGECGAPPHGRRLRTARGRAEGECGESPGCYFRHRRSRQTFPLFETY